MGRGTGVVGKGRKGVEDGQSVEVMSRSIHFTTVRRSPTTGLKAFLAHISRPC